MKRLCAALLFVATSAAAQASQSSRVSGTSEFGKYASAIAWKADSVVRVVSAAIDTASRASAGSGDGDGIETSRKLSALFNRNGVVASRLAKDFDAVVPPSDFTRLHIQLVEPLSKMASILSLWSALNNANCDAEVRINQSCDLIGRRAQAARAFLATFPSMRLQFAAYTDARNRAGRMLADHQTTLSSFEIPTP